MKREKGEYGYLKSYKMIKLGFSLLFAAMISFIIITTLMMYGDTMRVMIVFAILLALPFGKFVVAYIMSAKFKQLPEEKYNNLVEKLDMNCGRLLADVMISQYEGVKFYHVICVKNNQVIAYINDAKFYDNKKDYEKWLLNTVGNAKSKPVIKVYEKEQEFIKKVNSISEPNSNTILVDKNLAQIILDNCI